MKYLIWTLFFVQFLTIQLIAQEDSDFKIKENRISKITRDYYDFTNDITKKILTYSFTAEYDNLGRRIKTKTNHKQDEYTIDLFN